MSIKYGTGHRRAIRFPSTSVGRRWVENVGSCVAWSGTVATVKSERISGGTLFTPPWLTVCGGVRLPRKTQFPRSVLATFRRKRRRVCDFTSVSVFLHAREPTDVLFGGQWCGFYSWWNYAVEVLRRRHRAERHERDGASIERQFAHASLVKVSLSCG